MLDQWPWLALGLLGVYHGLNPAMGWLFAVALGLQRQSRRAVLQAIIGYDPEQILSHEVRFSAPVFPGDTITVDLWKEGKVVSFEARVKERNATVIKNGKTALRS